MAVLSACSYAGLVDQGLRYFNLMMNDYNIKPDREIYGCIMHLLGRARRVVEAYRLIQSMPFMPNEYICFFVVDYTAFSGHKLFNLLMGDQ